MEYITVCIITYNSSKYIIEALESVREQTYPYVDLIVSDDKSSDNTVEICKKWMDEHKDRFRKCELVLTEVNSGTAGNLNRGIARCETEWIKCMAGDDALYPDFLQKFIERYSDSEFDILCTDTGVYHGEFDENHFKYKLIPNPRFFAREDARRQYNILLHINLLGPTQICRKRLYDSVNGFDEKYPLIEDKPFYIKVTKLGISIGYAPLLATKYRISDASVQTGMLSARYEGDRKRFYQDVIIPKMDVIGKVLLNKWIKNLDNYYWPLNENKRTSIRYFKTKNRLIWLLWKIWEYPYISKGGMVKVRK